MALGFADVYSPQSPGLATVLGSGLAPLRVIQQEAYRRQQQAAAAAKEKAAAEKAQAAQERAFTVPKPYMNGGRLFAPQVAQSAQAAYDAGLGYYRQAAAGKLSPNEARMLTGQEMAKHEAFTRDTAAYQKEIDEFRANAPKHFIAPDKVEQAINTWVRDPATGEVIDLKTQPFNSAGLAGATTNPDYLDGHAVAQKFVHDLAQKQESDYTTAARVGQAGLHNVSSSNLYESHNGKPVLELGPDGALRPRFANLPGLVQEAFRNPQMTALLHGELRKGATSAAEALLRLTHGSRSDAQLDQNLEALNNQLDPATNEAGAESTMDKLLRPFATRTEKHQELSPLAVPHSRTTATHKLNPSQATATPTSDFGLSVGDTGTPTTELVENPQKAGLLNFLTPKVPRTTMRVQTFDNHYPHVGVSFATEKTPFVPLVVDSNELTTLGADGTPSHYNANQTNSQVKLNATDRSFVLEVNGKRLGLPKAGTSADAYRELRGMIDEMTPEQARRAVLKAYYHGTVLDKGRVGGDGAGGKAKVLGYKDEDGHLLTDAEAAANKRAGQVLTPVYDTRERQLKVMRPATAQLDAQAARQTPGYNPRQRTAQEADLIHRLEAKGGRVVDPYHTTPTAPAAQPTRPGFLRIKSSSAAPDAPADRSGGMLGDYQPPRVENGVRMTGGRNLLGTWGSGGKGHTPPATGAEGSF